MTEMSVSGPGAPAPVTRIVADRLLTCRQAPSDHRVGADPTRNGAVFIDGGAVDIGADGRITAVGPEADLGPAPERVERLGGLVMPGLVNAHAHTPMTLVRSVGDGLPLQRWLEEGIWPREGRLTPEDVFWGMLLGSSEMLLNGVTTSCEMYLHEEEMVAAVARTGARMVNTPGVISVLAPDGDVSGRIAQITDFHRRHHRPDNRIHVGFAPHSVYDLTPEQCGEIAAEAQAVDALFHIHLEETEAERELVRSRYGVSATRALADAGAFEGRAVAAHGVWLDADDRRILAEAGAAVAHCPQSNLKLGSGIAPLVELLAAGITVGLGTDGPASNDDLDLWDEITLAPLLARGVNHDPSVVGAATAIDLATRSSARAVGLDDVGSVEPGAWADLIRVDLDRPAFVPDDDLVTNLAFAGSSRHVTDVWVAGDRRVASGELVGVDLARCMHEVRVRARRLAG